MKIKILLSAFLMTASLFASKASTPLPAPVHNSKGTSLDSALQLRRSTREFDSKKSLDAQTISNLLWSAAGINRPEDGHRTNPTALNTQEIDIYLFTPEGVALYDFKEHALKPVAEGDHRSLLAGTKAFSQDFVMEAPAALLMVIDLSRFERGGDMALMMGMADAGIVSQNINLFCAANRLATVTRATMDGEGIKKLLNLTPQQIPALNNPVGYPKSL